ncbi:hypothetical protein ACQP1W_21100 [Spirillospora sp. CA-255316]
MELKIGQTLVSAVDSTAVVVVRHSGPEITVTCGGREMVPQASMPPAPPAPPAPSAGEGGGAQLGKRYTAEGVDIELLCVRAGTAELAVDGSPVTQKNARPLPASD